MIADDTLTFIRFHKDWQHQSRGSKSRVIKSGGHDPFQKGILKKYQQPSQWVKIRDLLLRITGKLQGILQMSNFYPP